MREEQDTHGWPQLNAEHATQFGMGLRLERNALMRPAKKGAQKSPKSTTATGKKPKGFTDEKRVAMKI